MRLRVFHRTRYAYSSEVMQNLNELRMEPVDDASQRLVSHSIRSVPGGSLRRFHDFYANAVHYLEVQPAHSELTIDSEAVVETSVPPDPADGGGPPARFADLEPCRRLPECYDFLLPSHFVGQDAALWRMAVDLSGGDDDPSAAAMRISDWINEAFTYLPGGTSVDTPAADAFARREGVCQDFAHVMIAMCRAINLPARYVSGYLFNGNGAALRGDQATHAWCEYYLPGFGWRGVDPTNRQPADARYVRIGVGRDYADVAPVKGTYRGEADAFLDVAVSVELLTEPEPNGKADRGSRRRPSTGLPSAS